MRVAIFTDNDFTKVNGVTTTLSAVLAHAPADIQPRIYTASGLGVDTPEYLALPSRGVPIPFYGEMRMYLPRYREYVRRVLRDGIDVLHLTTPGPLGLTALAIARRTGLPLVGSFHTNFGTYTTLLSGSPRLGHLMDEYMRWVYARCRQLLVPSVATRDALAAQGMPSDRVVIWQRGVDTEWFTPARRSPVLRDRWRADTDHSVLLYAGRVSREKGLDVLPPMLRRLQSLGLACRLVVAGDGPYREQLARECPSAIMTGALGRADIADVFASADLFVFPSRTDTAGNVVLEAQASGLPVIVAPDGGPTENMLSSITGLTCASPDPDAWANTASLLLRDDTQRRAMGVAARNYALSRQWPRVLEVLFDTYRDVAASATASRLAHHAA